MLLNLNAKPSPPEHYFAVKSSKDLLSSNKCKQLIKIIRKHVSLPKQQFNQYYLCAINNFAEFVQIAPASEFNHHAYPGGLIDHTLEVIELALKKRKGSLLPKRVTAESEPELRDVFTYGIFCSALCHDLAKPAVDQTVKYLKDSRHTPQMWNPYSGTLVQIGAKFLNIEFVRHGDYHLHRCTPMLFIHHILPEYGLRWLQCNHSVFKQFVDVLSGQQELNDIATIIKQADQYSTSRALGAQNRPTFLSEKPLYQKIKSTLRALISEGEITLNRKGANGWIAHEHVWILAKIAVDKIRSQLEIDGHTGIPSDNSRIFDIMMDNGLIMHNPDGNKAIWKIHIEMVDWNPENEFSVLKFPLNIAFASDNYNDFDGLVNVIKPPNKIEFSTIKYDDAPEKSTNINTTESHEMTGITVEKSLSTDNCQNIIHDVKHNHNESLRFKNATEKLLHNGNDPKTVRQHLGTDFLFWIKESIANQSFSKNTATSLIHNTEIGLLLVSPKIFKKYCEINSISNWQSVQKSFQSLRINLKTPDKGENAFKVRVSGKRKISILNCWIIPHDEFRGNSLPKINDHLEVLN